MSVLTRIKNNQITDSTILANTKIAPGSIVGSLFNSNLTMTSDVTITGNLTVQGSSTYLTVASTNTYVNDPLIVMNNAFTGTNTNDIGLLFNRGSDTNQAIIWDESEDEFRLIATSETGDTYGAVTTSSYANVRVGNLNVEGAAVFGSLSTAGDIGAVNLTLSGDAAVNGGDLTTTATTFNLVNTDATTVNFAGAASTLIVGSTTGTANIRNATTNIIGNATVGGTLGVTGHVTLEGVTSAGATGTGNLVFSDSPTLTTPNIGTPSFVNLTNATDLPISTGISGLAAGIADFLATPTSSNLISAVTDETGTGNLVFSDSPTLTTPNIGTPNFANLTNATNLPISTGVSGLAAGIADFLATPTSSNLISAVTDETGTGNLVFSTSPTLETSLATTSTSFDLLNTAATTVNFAGAATTLTIGAVTGTLTVRNELVDIDGNATIGGTLGVTGDTTLTGDLAVNGGDITTTATTVNLLDNTATTVNAFGAATEIDLGATTGTLTINNPTVVGTQTTQNLYNTTATTLNFAGAATTLTLAATSGNTEIRNNLNVGLTLTAQDINNTVIGNVTPAAATFTTATVQGNTSLGLTSAAAINNTPIGNATPSTGSFTTLLASGVTQITDTTVATSVGTGAFRVDGGASVAGNLWVGGNINIVGNTFTITGNSGVFYGDANGFGALYAGVAGFTPLPQTVFQVAASVDNYAQINFENIDTGTDASTDYVATAGNGNDFNHYINMGITSPNWDGTQDNSLTTALSGNDGYLYAQGDVAGGGNLVIGASTPERTVSIIVGGNTASNITAVYRAPGTASTNTTTGALTVVGGVGILGNVYANNLSTGGEISAADLTLTGDLAVNGGDLTTTATTFNLLDANATTVNAFGAATTIDLGAVTGTLTINNPTVVGTSATQDLYNTAATTLNFAGAATTLNIGADTGTATINNDTVNLEGNVNINKTTPSTNSTSGALVVDGGVGIAGNLNVGENLIITGNLTVQGEVTTLNTATLDVEDLNITVAKGAADSAAADGAGLTVDGASATLLYNHATTSWDLNKITRVTDTTDTTDATSGSFQVAGGVAIAKDLFVGGGDIITDETTFNLLDATVTTLNIGGAATAIDLGATTGTLTINNPTVVGSQTTQDLYNTTATTVNFAGAATTLTIGAATGTTNIRNALVDIDGNATVGGTLGVTGDTTLTGDLAVNGGDLTTTATTFNLLDATAETVNAFGAATAIDLGAATGTLTINNPTVVGASATQNLYNTTATTLNFAGAATTLTIGAVTGTTNIRNALVDIDGNATVGGTLGVTGAVTFTDDLAVNGGDITTTSTTATVFNTNATTVDAFKAATDLEFGATTGTLTINNPTVVGTQTTQNLYNTTATTVNFAGAATTLSIGASSGNTSINNTLDVASTVVISSTGIELANTKITNLQGPTAGADAANKTYVDTELDTFTGTANITLVGTLPNLTVGNLDVTTIQSTGTATLGNLTADRINDTVIGDVTPAAATFTSVTDQSLTATRVTFAGTGGDLTDSAEFTFDSNILTIKNFSINGDTAEISVVGGSGNVILNPDVGGVIDGTGSLVSNIADPVSAQDAVTLNYLQTQLNAGINLLTSDDTDVTITDDGIDPGVITANVDAVSVLTITSASADFFTDLLSLNDTDGNVTVTGNLSVTETTTLNDLVSITDATASTEYSNGALTVDGGVGVAGNISVKLGQQITVGIEDPSANVSFPERQMILIANANVASGINVRNVSSAEAATSNFIAIADNNVGENHIVVMGIAGSGFTDSNTAVKANDAYIFANSDGVTGGNLHLSADKAIYLTIGNALNQVTQISNSNVTVLKDTISTSSSTGALVVEGGVGLGANLNVSGGTVINIDQTAEAFQVKGQFATTLIYADSVTDTVTIGGSNTTPISGATLRINGTGALVLPVGTTSQRPGSSGNVDVAGMMRINSSLNILEYYDGTAWQSSQGSFTVISNDSFSGNGVATVFTMGGSATTASTIVSINGIVQIPATSYSITDDILTFTEAPEVGDTIDVRRLTTTVSVDELGFNQNLFRSNVDYAYISTGSVSSIDRLLIDDTGLVTVTGDMEIYGNLTVKGDTNGQINIGDSNTDNVAITAEINSNLVPSTNNIYDLGSAAQRWRNVYSHATIHDETPTNISANATPTVIDQFFTSDYSSAKYLVQIKDGSDIQAAELLLVHDTANVYITTYGVLSSNVELGSFTAEITSGAVFLYYTSTTATNSNVKVHTTYIV